MSTRRNAAPRHVSVRLRPEVVARIDALAERITPRGSPPSRSFALRAVIHAGLDGMEKRHPVQAPADALSNGHAGNSPSENPPSASDRRPSNPEQPASGQR